MEKLRILFGSKKDLSRDSKVYEATKQAYKRMIESTGKYEVEKFEMAFTKEALSVKIQLGDFNTLITTGTFYIRDSQGNNKKDSIGVGSLKIWKGLYPNMTFYIMESASLKGGMKMLKFFRDVSYYDAVIIEDTDDAKQVIEKLIQRMLNPRSAEEAFEEYGLATNVEAEKYMKENFPDIYKKIKKNVDEISIEESETSIINNTRDSVSPNNEEAEVSDGEEENVDSMLEEGMEMFSDMKLYDVSDKEPESEKTIGAFEYVEEDTNGPVHGFGFDLSSINFEEEKEDQEGRAEREILLVEGVREIFSEVIREGESKPTHEEVERERQRIRDEKLVEELCEQSEKDVEEVLEMENRHKAVKAEFSKMKNVSLPVKGRIMKVVDEDTLMIEFLEDFSLAGELEEYKCVVMVRTGEKGKVVNGRYVSSKITFDSFIICSLDGNRVMAETPAFNCESRGEALLNRVVNVLFIKL